MRVNQSRFTNFEILGLSDLPYVKSLLFFLVLLIYVVALAGNLTILLVSYLDKTLHTPMYMFLGNLSLLDICYTSTTMPKMLQVLLVDKKTISFIGCVIQLYIFFSCVGTECILLAIMSYDRFLAICSPLQYLVIMNSKLTNILAGASWLSGLLNSIIHTCFTFSLDFCGSNQINYFFCDIPPLLSLSCDDTFLNELLLQSVGVFIAWTPFLCITVSYIYIIVTILKIRSNKGRVKAFSTCFSHIAVVILYYGSSISNYVRPASTHALDKDRVISVLYSVVTPMLNPIIYTLKNQDVKKAVVKQLLYINAFKK
ncbi:PREDICTED: olfactory receptor 5V1-like [Nanorana parkeri]|uniref:olfactory receptor 5V1-like n=1 Tax=Nanorana parkeri TaxID=125878 RepID=UPI000853FD08|nr:PREDICTED: olfactory receptor 5V1-like [Nanorana parkeri]